MVVPFDVSNSLQHVDKRLEITRALMALLQDRRFDQVKVADLCRVCNISRSTFYRYFSGVSDIPLWYRNYGAELGIHQIGRRYSCREGHTISVSLLALGAVLYREYVRSPLTLNASFNYAATELHVNAMSQVLSERGVAIDPKTQHTLEAVAYGACAAVAGWIKSEMDLTVEQMVDVLTEVYPRWLRDIFDEPLQPNGASVVLGEIVRALGR